MADLMKELLERINSETPSEGKKEEEKDNSSHSLFSYGDDFKKAFKREDTHPLGEEKTKSEN